MATEPDAAPLGFGEILRQRRRAAGLTQEALAERAGLSKRGISDLERGARTRPQRETIKHLADALALAGPKRAVFVAAARPSSVTGTSAIDLSRRGPLPAAQLPAPIDALIGRERELTEIASLVRGEGVRLVTLTGPGGVGKTRLAMAVASSMQAHYADGVIFVDLAPIRDPALVLPAIAERLGMRETSGRRLADRLRDRLARRTVLLVLDNLEQVLAAAPDLAELPATCPGLTILATSRAPMRVSGEHVYGVPPLSLPDRDGSSPVARLGESDAVRLFAARARAVGADFLIDAANGSAVAEICRRLDGLPLAIELAAARTTLLSPEALLVRLEPRLPMLTAGRRDAPERQQTMSAAIAWSYDLLGSAEQALFRRLAVFVGGWTLESAEAVVGADAPEHLSALAALADAHLVARRPGAGAEARFGMLETVREFGLERLAASGEEDAVRRRHAAYFVNEVEAAGPWLEDNRGGPWQRGAGIDQWLDRLTAEWPNVRAAADWAVRAGEGEVLLRLGCAIYPFFNTYSLGESSEGRRWLDAGLAAGDGPDIALRIWALGFASTLATVDGDHEQGVALADDGLALARAHGYRRGEAEAMDSLGFSAMFRGDLEQAEAMYGSLLDLLLRREANDAAWESSSLKAFSGGRPADDSGWVAHTYDSLAHVALGRGDVTRAAELAENARRLLPAGGSSAHHARLLGTLGEIALAEGILASAASHWAESLRQWRDLRNRRGVADGMAGLAGVLQARGEDEASNRLLGAADALLEEVGARHLIHAVALDRKLAAARATLEGSTAAAWEQGREAPDEIVVAALALAETIGTEIS